MSLAPFYQHIIKGTIAGRPAATTVKAGTLYRETDGMTIWRSNASTWSAYAYILPPGGASGDALAKSSGSDGDYTWVAP